MNLATPEVEWKSIAENRDLFHLVCLLTPPRKGIRLFLAKLEHEHYNPVYGPLSKLQVRYIKWEGFEFALASVPVQDRPILHRVAEECRLYLHDGVPTVIDTRGQRWFPISSPRVFSLLGYRPTQMSPKQRAEEEAEIQRIRRRTWSVLGDAVNERHE